MNRHDNDARYPSPYRQDHLPPIHRSTSAINSSRNDYDVRSMLSSRALPSKDPKEQTNRWQGQPVPDNYEQRNSQRLQHTHQAPGYQNNRFSRGASPMRRYSYTPRESDYEKPEASVRREYSPQRRERRQDGSFRGFTTPFPGSECGASDDNPAKALRSPSMPRYTSLLSSGPHENLHTRHRPYADYGHPPRSDYAPESHRHTAEHRSEMRDPPESRYAASVAGSSIAARRRSYSYGRAWDEGSNYGNVPDNQGAAQPKLDESTTLSPRTFQRECQRVYHEARTQRLRNLEEGLYGKCTWATYDSKYC